jgi:hypothetical protein
MSIRESELILPYIRSACYPLALKLYGVWLIAYNYPKVISFHDEVYHRGDPDIRVEPLPNLGIKLTYKPRHANLRGIVSSTITMQRMNDASTDKAINDVRIFGSMIFTDRPPVNLMYSIDGITNFEPHTSPVEYYIHNEAGPTEEADLFGFWTNTLSGY